MAASSVPQEAAGLQSRQSVTTLYYLRDQRGCIHICDDEGAHCNADMDGAVQVDVVEEAAVCESCKKESLMNYIIHKNATAFNRMAEGKDA